MVGGGIGCSGRSELQHLLFVGAMEPLLEERLHRAGRQVAPPHQPLISLKDVCDVNPGGVLGQRPPCRRWTAAAEFSFGAPSRNLSVAAAPASQIVRGPSGGQT